MRIFLHINLLAPKQKPNEDVNPTTVFIDVILLFNFFFLGRV
jgi:hypothetical protein